MLDMFFGPALIGNEYENIRTGEKIYIDDQSLYRMTGSNGSAAGNSFKESFNEGYSEICERDIQKFFFQDAEHTYRVIKCESILEPKLKEIITLFNKLGVKL